MLTPWSLYVSIELINFLKFNIETDGKSETNEDS